MVGGRCIVERSGWAFGRCRGRQVRRSAPIAQLDRASGYEPGGRTFESCWAHHLPAEGGAGAVTDSDVSFMREALIEAERAAEAGEVPVGAVVVQGSEIVGRGRNQPITASDPTAHAEVVALREAARTLGNYRLTGVRLYVTVEPCLMCVGAMVHARVGTLIFGAREPKAGAVVSSQQALDHAALNHRVEVVEGILADESRELLQRFFQARRAASRSGQDAI